MIDLLLIILLFLVGFWAIVAKKHIIKKIFGLSLVSSAVVLLFVLEGSRIGEEVPILEDGIALVVDPIPQALMLTAIVIGVCMTALALALAFKLYQATGTFAVDEIRERLYHES
ncbi:multisubunit Na+/H+ antiporter, MnhC subunit [Sphaerochaeta pleomorpha str. Grapes]|uniref:Multisubunit Na+/H+ antiporter, MnhC subunit n=1 Tax=Sphaerochaeta pleomorpha (strain ATCC BAA-1885 / DSM 22778 / Grapes) TaxID=158190 RepID=G8QTV0_SPHPG|nr:Na+/H+ antiporter subunit C [Sphaerochaeta pleomorpha]AEV29126.1 multisubunit Na+/H+ antiporter, MnhC subunit [Sphaerochaeta pleomorpha str. Grapes]